MGSSITMIDLHYGHLAVDSGEHAVSLLDALALERAVDAGWTSAGRPGKLHSDTVPRVARGVHPPYHPGTGARAGPHGYESAASQTDLTRKGDRPWTCVVGRVFAPRSHRTSTE
jgi:hypothetical protein